MYLRLFGRAHYGAFPVAVLRVCVSDDRCHSHSDCDAYGLCDSDRYGLIMPTLRARYSFTLISGTVGQEFAQPFIPPSIELDSAPLRYVVEVPADSTVTIWDAAAGGANPTAFKFLLMHSDIEVEVEQTVEAAGPLTSLSTFTLAENHIPFILGSDIARASADFDGDAFANGTLGVITKLRAKNSSTDTSAFIEVVVGGA